MSLSKELIDRVVCSKFIYHKGLGVIDKEGYFSSGLGVLHFQDSIEMILRVIAEYLHCNLKETSAFNQIIDSINEKTKTEVPFRTALNQINRARVNFKHSGLEPKRKDVLKFKSDLESFFPEITKRFFGMEFHSISLINLIGHRRIENFLNKAEKQIEAGDYKEAICSISIAFAIFNKGFNPVFDEYQVDSFRALDDLKIEKWIKDIEEAVVNHQLQLNLLINGINPSDYKRFKMISPGVAISRAGTYQVYYSGGKGKIEPILEDAIFCMEFVIEAILLMKENELYFLNADRVIPRRFKVIREGDIAVYPSEDREVIRQSEVGEVLAGGFDIYDKENYIAINVDGDKAFIASDCIKEISHEN